MYFTPEVAPAFSSLGCFVGEKYELSADAAETMDQMMQNIAQEDKLLRTYRRSMGFSQVVQKDLAPILIWCKDNQDIFLKCVR